MKKKNENKSEKVLKILKIVGSAIGLTLCTAAVVFLMVIGIRGCASSSVRSNDREAQTQERAANYIDEPQNIVGDYNVTYYNWLPLNAKNTLIDQLIFVDHTTGTSVDDSVDLEFDITYKGVTYTSESLYVYFDGSDYTIEFIQYEQWNEDKIILGYQCSRPNNTFQVDAVYSDDVFYDFNFGGNNGWVGMPAPYDITIERKTQSVPLNNITYTAEPWFYYFTNAEPDILNFTFNETINPYGPLGGNYDYFVNTGFDGGKYIVKGLFQDQTGEYYTGIQIFLTSANGVRYGTATEYQVYSGSFYRYMAMYFIDLQGRQVMVNRANYVTATAGSDVNNVVYTLGNSWVSNLFRTIKIYYLMGNSGSDFIGSSMKPIVSLSTLNNVSATIGVTQAGGSVGTTSVFTLIGTAFSALVPIFNTQVLPGVNLWTLLLVPLMGTIVIFVVWLFKR